MTTEQSAAGPDRGYEFLDAVVARHPSLGEDPVDLVRDYFHSGLWTGSRFERLSGGGDRPEAANRLELDDLIAVTTLSVRIWPGAMRALLHDRAEEINTLLTQIPLTPLHETDPSVIAPGSSLWDLWDLLMTVEDVKRTKASKIMARKRPHLVPVQDRRVREALGAPRDYWRWLQVWLQTDDHVAELEALRAAVGGVDDISLIRILDVAVWRLAERDL